MGPWIPQSSLPERTGAANTGPRGAISRRPDRTRPRAEALRIIASGQAGSSAKEPEVPSASIPETSIVDQQREAKPHTAGREVYATPPTQGGARTSRSRDSYESWSARSPMTYFPQVAATISSDFLRLADGAWDRPLGSGRTSHTTLRFPATLAGAGSGSQVPRTRSHRLTHQPDGPRPLQHRAPDPVMPCRAASQSRLCRQLSPLTTRLPKNPLPPPSFRDRRAVRQEVGPHTSNSLLHISEILCL